MLIHKTQLRVRYADTDQMHYVYNGKYIEYFEVGRTEMIREQNLTPALLLAQEMMTRTQLEGLAAASGHLSGDFETTHPDLYPRFRWQREILSTDIDSLWEVRVRVLWGEQEGQKCELTYFTPLKP